MINQRSSPDFKDEAISQNVDLACDVLGDYSAVRIISGLLAVGHRPRLRNLPHMHASGFTHIVSVLSHREDPESIRSACKDAGLLHVCIPIGTTKSLPKRRKPEIVQALDQLIRILNDGGCIYLHCSAGIHRTGMISAALLFYCGADAGTVRRLLKHLRPITAQELGEARFDWAATFSSSAIRRSD